MKLYAPKYYNKFKCIADKCRHNCCIGWEIDIDGNTLERYKAFTDGYGKEITKTIDFTDTPHFKLSDSDRCPHLDERGLCGIITNLGDKYLCDICREHPRFYNDTARGKAVGLGLSCEEAARIILSSDDYAEMILLGECEGEAVDVDFDVLPYIEKIYSVLSNELLTYNAKLSEIYEMGGNYDLIVDDDKIRALLSSLEYLREDNRELFARYKSSVTCTKNLEKLLERSLAYFVFRHLPKACDEQELYAYLGFCLLCERLIAFLSCLKGAATLDDFSEVARVVSEELEYSEDNTYVISSEFI